MLGTDSGRQAHTLDRAGERVSEWAEALQAELRASVRARRIEALVAEAADVDSWCDGCEASWTLRLGDSDRCGLGCGACRCLAGGPLLSWNPWRRCVLSSMNCGREGNFRTVGTKACLFNREVFCTSHTVVYPSSVGRSCHPAMDRRRGHRGRLAPTGRARRPGALLAEGLLWTPPAAAAFSECLV